MLDRLVCCIGSVLVAAWLLVGCSGGGRALEQLDERSGMTIVRAKRPLVFARTEPRYSRSARDYVYLGPVETNRQGVREYYLWVGIATTLDRGFLAPVAAAPSTLYVEVGGEPIELRLRPWRDVVPTLGEPVYATAVAVEAELVARVSLQQLVMLDAQRLDTVAVGAAPPGAPRAYVRWQDDAGFSDFLDGVSGGIVRSVQ